MPPSPPDASPSPQVYPPPVPSPLPILAVLATLIALDAGIRRAGMYASSVFHWPAGWRAIPPGAAPSSPYRHHEEGAWALVADAGIPRVTSVFLPAVLGIVLLWGLGTMLALGDLADVVRGTRSLPFVLASLTLCVVRALDAGATLLAAYERRSGAFFLASALALGIDVALAELPLPCSDNRSDDVHMALAGAAAQAALALGYAVSVWRRRGLVGSVDPSLPPEDR